MGSKEDFPADPANSPVERHTSDSRQKTPVLWRFFAVAKRPFLLVTTLVVCVIPLSARAGVFDSILSLVRGKSVAASEISSKENVQTMWLLRPAMNIDPVPARGGGGVMIVDNSALLPEEGPSGTIADIEKPKNGTISTYVVRQGDTLTGIAKMFEVSPNTILWANDLPRGSTLRVGQTLTILPVTGLKYTVKKGDTLASIAKKYHADATEIGTYNDIGNDTLAAGLEIIIPDGEIAAPPPAPRAGTSPVLSSGPVGTLSQVGYYLRPIIGGTRTQGIHGYNGIDIGAPVGTPVMASATGDVTVARDGGWNGGYGSYVVITHDNGSQTLYAHLSRVATYSGQHVMQGQVIGYVGRTGKVTGAHLHFEIRGGIRNPF